MCIPRKHIFDRQTHLRTAHCLHIRSIRPRQENKRHQRIVRKASKLGVDELLEIAAMKRLTVAPPEPGEGHGPASSGGRGKKKATAKAKAASEPPADAPEDDREASAPEADPPPAEGEEQEEGMD